MNQQEELLRLQKLIADQQKEIQKLNIENAKLQAQNENMTQAVLHAQKKIFGSSSERSAQTEG